jgi:hypothetical protein
MMVAAQLGNKPAAASVGVIAAVIAVEVAALANLGDPGEFDDAEQHWRDQVLSPTRTEWQDLVTAYNQRVKNDWVGNGGNAFDAYVNTTLKDAEAALEALLKQLAESCNAIQTAVLVADIAVVAFTVASCVFLNAVFASYIATGGLAAPALVTAFIAYCAGLVTFIGAVAALFGVFQAQATALLNAANDLDTKIWQDVKKREGSRVAPGDLHIPPVGQWRHSPMLNKR